MRRSLALSFCTLALIACSQSAPRPTHPSIASPIPGAAASADGGAAEYEIPIQLTDSDKLFRPSISLRYRSRSGNGVAGMGWSLSASGSVHRCPFIFDGDGLSRKVSYATDDRLCLNGVKLVLLRGDYGKDGSIYVPELNPTVALRLIGDLNSPKSAFIAADGEENTDVYQTPVIPKGVSAPLSWLLSVSADKAGHVIEYSYTQRDFGDLFLDRILYGG